MIGRVGCRAHDYGNDTIENLTQMMAEDGYKTTQLALKKAIEGVGNLQEALTEDRAEHIQTVMQASDVTVSVLGAYLNYGHPMDEVRDDNIITLKKHLMVAKTMGARMVGTETGSLDAGYKAHPENHDEVAYIRFKDAMESVLQTAEAYDTLMAVEAVAHHIIHTPERMYRLIKDINHPRLKVIFDINNLITYENQYEQEALIHQMFDLLDEHILVVHVKDFDFVNGEKVIVPIGTGKLALNTLMDRVKKSTQTIDILAENVPTQYLKVSCEKLKVC